MRTQIEIIERIRAIKKRDYLGFGTQLLVPRLSAVGALEFCKAGADMSKWPGPEPHNRETILKEMRNYMDFAWEKAMNHRGISAYRSITKMTEWLWLLGDNKLVTFAEDEGNFAQYGIPVLRRICVEYGFPIPDGEDVERMAAGKACDPQGCEMGCGT